MGKPSRSRISRKSNVAPYVLGQDSPVSKKKADKGTGPVPKTDPSEIEDGAEHKAESKVEDKAEDTDKGKASVRAHAETVEPPSTRKTAEQPALPDTRPTPKLDLADVVDPVDDDPKPQPMVVAESPRARTMTFQPGAVMAVGRAPDMPTTIPPVNVSMGGVEDPTNMPGPLAIPGGHPTDPAAAPGLVPRGDSRSLRNLTNEFALIYRQATFVITRSGLVGTRGTWRVVEYPTSASASHAYAKECSRFVSEGFSDYRE